MGRLFWKFFFFIWLAQLSAVAAVSTVFWIERQNDLIRWQAQMEKGAAAHPAMRPEKGEFSPPPSGAAPPGAVPLQPDGPRLHGRHGPHRPLPMVPLIATLLASLVFAALLAWYFAKPIRSLKEALEAAATGDLGVRVGARMGRRRDELADLGRHFDRMAGQLQVLVDGQRRLLHDVSHELRSPLARLQAAVGLWRQSATPERSLLDRVENECQRMDQLVGELLTLARLDASLGAGEMERVEIAELIEGIVSDARFEAAGRRIDTDLAPGIEVLADAGRLHRAIENIVRNAIRHTPSDTAIGVVLSVEAGLVVIRVLDDGAGVPEDDLEAIFQPFHRSAAGGSRSGHGLGLAIARRIVEKYGGRISAVNRPAGGLGVEIRLPPAPSSAR